MNIITTKTPMGWQAYDDDQFDGPGSAIGYGDDPQQAADDLCDLLGVPYIKVDSNNND